MKTLVIVAAIVGVMFVAPDAGAARKHLAVHKTERLHEHCSCAAKGAAPTLSFQTSGVDANAARPQHKNASALPAVDSWKCFCWLFALTITGVFMVKQPLADTSHPTAFLQTQRCIGREPGA
jgi:hypothetical protein